MVLLRVGTTPKQSSYLSIADFAERRNKILILRENGGLGDILMHRMMFEDFKSIIPDCKITFACPLYYHQAVDDHPFIDEIIDSKDVKISNFNISYNTTSACSRYEMSIAPLSGKHRSDIWANHCGVVLKNHNMHINLENKYLNYGFDTLKQFNTKNEPVVVLCPISAMVSKNLTPEQMSYIVSDLRKRGYFVCGLHNKHIPELTELGVPVIYGVSIKQWMGILSASNYIISVDSAAFHYAGGINKPLLGIFSFADGKVYGKYYNFELVQKHRDNGDWDCGPCYSFSNCCKSKKLPRPCLLEINKSMLIDGIERLLNRWSK